METELLLTADGSHTLYISELDESYHSTYGAIQESTHIFIHAGLNHCKKKEINLLEVGFGTGLNALLCAFDAQKSTKRIRYTTLEKYPLTVEKALQLNYSQQVRNETAGSLFNKIHTAEWEKEEQISENFILKKRRCDFSMFNEYETYDVVFFDAFSPEKQPEMWTVELFQKIYSVCNGGAILTTYCAKGSIRRALQSAGFSVERLPGPPGKREILRATK